MFCNKYNKYQNLTLQKRKLQNRTLIDANILWKSVIATIKSKSI